MIGRSACDRRALRLVVPVNRPLAVLLGGVVVFMAGVFAIVALSVSPDDAWGAYVDNAINLAGVAWALGLVASTRVVGKEGVLRVVNFLTVVRIPASRIADVSSENGLAVGLDDGSRVDCVVHGGSVLQMLIPRIQPKRAAARVEDWLRDQGSRQHRELAGSSVRSTVRAYLWCGIPVSLVVSFAYLAVVRVFAEPLRAMVGVNF